jgi:hypothetical protein
LCGQVLIVFPSWRTEASVDSKPYRDECRRNGAFKAIAVVDPDPWLDRIGPEKTF